MQDKRLIGLTGSSIVVKLSDEVQVDDLKIGAIEKDEVITGSSLARLVDFFDLDNFIYVSQGMSLGHA